MKICPQCSREFEDKFKFCRHDGAALHARTLGSSCPKCGKEAEERKKFCRHCGAKLEPERKTSDKAVGHATIDSQLSQTDPAVGNLLSAQGPSAYATEKPQGELREARASCPQCGTEIETGKKFCRNCGAKLELGNEAGRENIDKPESPGVVSPQKARPESTERDNGVADTVIERIPPQTIQPEEILQENAARPEPPIQAAERHLKDKDYRNALLVLEPIVNNEPNNQEARLLHLLASIKLYNVYGYETQVESIKRLSSLSEKERGLAREIFLLRSDEAHKRGQEDAAREYQRLASRVILGQSLTDPDPQTKPREASTPGREVKSFPERKVERVPEIPPKITPTLKDQVEAAPRQGAGQKRRSRAFLIIAGVVLGVSGILGGGLLAYYAKDQGLSISSIYQKIFSGKDLTGRETKLSGKTNVAQVLAAEELGFKVWGTGAADTNRRESLLSEKIESQLDSLRQFYTQQVRQKPDLMGSMTIQLTIAPSGHVTKVDEFGSQIKDSEFKKSVIGEAYKWRFPEATSGLVKINYPLLFLPPGMDVATLLKWEQSISPRALATKDPATGEDAETSAQLTKSAPAEYTDARKLPPPLPSPQPKFEEIKARSPSPSPQPPLQQPPAPPQITVRDQYEVLYPTSVYREPKEDSERVASIPAGVRVNVVAIRGDWLEVRSKQGNPPGFIKKESAVSLGSR